MSTTDRPAGGALGKGETTVVPYSPQRPRYMGLGKCGDKDCVAERRQPQAQRGLRAGKAEPVRLGGGALIDPLSTAAFSRRVIVAGVRCAVTAPRYETGPAPIGSP